MATRIMKTKLQRAAAQDQKDTKARELLRIKTTLGAVIVACRDGTFDHSAGMTSDTFTQLVSDLTDLKATEVGPLCDAAGVKRTATVNGIKRTGADLLCEWFENGGSTEEQRMRRHWDAKETNKWATIARKLLSISQLKALCSDAKLKVGGTKEELTGRLKRFLNNDLQKEDHARSAVSKAPTTVGETAAWKAQAQADALRSAFQLAKPDATDAELDLLITAYLEQKKANELTAKKKAAATKIGQVFAV